MDLGYPAGSNELAPLIPAEPVRAPTGHLDEVSHLLGHGFGACSLPVRHLVPRCNVAVLGGARVVALDALYPRLPEESACCLAIQRVISPGRYANFRRSVKCL